MPRSEQTAATIQAKYRITIATPMERRVVQAALGISSVRPALRETKLAKTKPTKEPWKRALGLSALPSISLRPSIDHRPSMAPLKAPPVDMMTYIVTARKASSGTSARQAAGLTPGAVSRAVPSSETMGWPPGRSSWPVVRARISAFSIGPKSRPVKTIRPTKKIVKMQ